MLPRYPRQWGNMRPPQGTQIDPGHSLSRDLVAAWAFNEAGGLKCFNGARNNHHGSITSNVVRGPRGILLDRNAYANYMASSGPPYLTPSSAQSHSYVVWGVPTGSFSAYNWILNNGNDTLGSSLILYSGSPAFFYGGASGLYYASKSVTIGKMACIAASYNGATNTVKLYLDGILVGTGSGLGVWTGSTTAGTLDLGIWNRYAHCWNGWISQARVYNRALGASEIAQLYSTPWAGYLTPVVGLVNPEAPNNGTLSATSDPDTLSATGTVLISGSLSAVTSSSVSATGSVAITGALSATSAASSLSGIGAHLIYGSLSAIADSAILAATGSVKVSGSLSATVSSSLSATGIVYDIGGTLAATTDDCAIFFVGGGILSSPSRLRVPRYRDPFLRYREIGTGYRRLYDPAHSATISDTQPTYRGYSIRIYDREDLLRHVLSSNVERPLISEWSFELLDTGCGSFDLKLAKALPLEHGWRVDFHLFNDSIPWYSGMIQTLPSQGGTKRLFEVGGFGWMALADDVIYTYRFTTGVRPSQIADALAQAFSSATNGRVRYLASKIVPSSYRSLGDVRFLRTDLKTAMRAVADLAGGWEWGVDERRQIFFRPPNKSVVDDSRWWVGKHLETYLPTEDSSKIKNRIYVKLGKVRTDLSSTHELFGTNFLESPVEDPSSQKLYGVRAKIYSAPSVLSPTDAIRGAAVDLRRMANPIRKAKITGIEVMGEKISCQGYARVVGPGGVSLTLPKKKVKYSANSSGMKVSVDLGDLDTTPQGFFALITQAQAEEANSRQVSQSQF